MSHTKSVLIDRTGVDAVTGTDPSAGLVLFKNDEAKISSSWGTSLGTDVYQFQDPNGASPRFSGGNVISATKAAYRAGTAQVVTVTVVPDTDTNLSSIKLIDVTDGREKFSMATFESTNATAATAASELRTAINASERDVFADIVASGATTAVIITCPVDVIIRVATNDASSQTDTTAPILSSGTVAKVNADLEDALPFQGITNIAGPNVVKPAALNVASGNYDKYTIFVKETVGMREDIHEIVVYYEDTNEIAVADMTGLFGIS